MARASHSTRRNEGRAFERWLLKTLAVEDLEAVGLDLVLGAAAISVTGARGCRQHDHPPAVPRFVQVDPDLVGGGVLVAARHVRVNWPPNFVFILGSTVVRFANPSIGSEAAHLGGFGTFIF